MLPNQHPRRPSPRSLVLWPARGERVGGGRVRAVVSRDTDVQVMQLDSALDYCPRRLVPTVKSRHLRVCLQVESLPSVPYSA